jgi:transcriptional regulator with XRE-family HTH domain
MPLPDLAQRPVITGQRLWELRKAAGKTQMELARELGVQQAHISQLEAGRGELSVALLVRLAHVFGVTTDYLVGLSDLPSAPQAAAPPAAAVPAGTPAAAARRRGRPRRAATPASPG